MKKKTIIILSVILTVITAALRIWTTLFYTNPSTGEITQELFKYGIMAAVCLCVIIPAFPITDIFHSYKIPQNENKLPSRIILVICAISSVILFFHSVTLYIQQRNLLNTAFALGALICTVFFIYTAVSLSDSKKETLMYFSIGPFLIYILRIIQVFNLYSRRVSLYTYKYELAGICALVIFYLTYVRLACDRNPTKNAIFFGLNAFSLLFIYSVPNMILQTLKGNLFIDPTAVAYLLFDFAMALGALYFTAILKAEKTTKH